MNIIRIDTAPSTNTLLKELASRENLKEGTVLIASDQTAGRGQVGAYWEAEANKNLTFSLLLYPTFLSLKRNFLLSELISLSIKEVLDQYTGHIAIKWPNDIYYQDKKLAGVLIENEIMGTCISRSIIGIGLNVNQEVFRSNAPNPVSLKQILNVDLDLDVLSEAIILRILREYQSLWQGNDNGVTEKYHQALYRNSGYHLFSDKDGTFSARIDSVGDDGVLTLVTDQGKVNRYFFKEVKFM